MSKETMDVVTVVTNRATRDSAVVQMSIFETSARLVDFDRDARVDHWISEDVPDGYMRIWWGDTDVFEEVKVRMRIGDSPRHQEVLQKVVKRASDARIGCNRSR